jgi:hypothetical protein
LDWIGSLVLVHEVSVKIRVVVEFIGDHDHEVIRITVLIKIMPKHEVVFPVCAVELREMR